MGGGEAHGCGSDGGSVTPEGDGGKHKVGDEMRITMESSRTLENDKDNGATRAVARVGGDEGDDGLITLRGRW